jgi:uncharacterized integral membrane protein
MIFGRCVQSISISAATALVFCRSGDPACSHAPAVQAAGCMRVFTCYLSCVWVFSQCPWQRPCMRALRARCFVHRIPCAHRARMHAYVFVSFCCCCVCCCGHTATMLHLWSCMMVLLLLLLMLFNEAINAQQVEVQICHNACHHTSMVGGLGIMPYKITWEDKLGNDSRIISWHTVPVAGCGMLVAVVTHARQASRTDSCNPVAV